MFSDEIDDEDLEFMSHDYVTYGVRILQTGNQTSCPHARHLDAFCYEDDLLEQFHREVFSNFVDPFELGEAEEIAERKELQRLREIEKVRIVLSMMKPIVNVWIQ